MERERDEANRSHALRIADLEKSLGEIAKTKDDGEREQDESLRSLRAVLHIYPAVSVGMDN